MNNLVYGGHAIMLAVEIPARVRFAVQDVVREGPHRESKIDSAHVTLVFVGRDLHEWIGVQMASVASEASVMAPKSVQLTGELEMFGRDMDHLVALVKDDGLTELRERIVFKLAGRGITVTDNFGFNPHVTLARCESNLAICEHHLLEPVRERPTLRATALSTKVGSKKVRHPI